MVEQISVSTLYSLTILSDGDTPKGEGVKDWVRKDWVQTVQRDMLLLQYVLYGDCLQTIIHMFSFVWR